MREAELEEALKAMLHAVCGENGFAECVRRDSGFAYPWPALDNAEIFALKVLGNKHENLEPYNVPFQKPVTRI